MTKKDIIQLLEQIATYMELSLENSFKVSAYRKAAQAIEQDSRSLKEIDDFSSIKGIGKGVNDVITEYIETGESQYFKDLKSNVPKGLVRMLKVPSLGPKKIAKIYKSLNIDTLEGLIEACEKNEISDLSGFGKKTEENILHAIQDLMQRPERYPIERIQTFVTLVNAVLDDMNVKYEVAGSARRFKETSKDIDYIVETGAVDDVTKTLTNQSFVKDVVASGEKKLSIIIEHDLDDIGVDFRFVKPEEFATTLHHFTGSKDHNVKMRQIAKSRGEKISEYGVTKGDKTQTFKTEEEFFNHFNLDYIPPTMRETGEEVESDISQIVTMDDIKGDLHMHTVWSDGAHSIEEMVEAAIHRNLEYIVITDHSKNLKVANGLNEKRLMEQVEEIRKINDMYSEIDVYSGTEMDILSDGTMDFSNDVLKELDYVIGAIHTSFNQTEDEIMTRLLNACDNPYVRHIAHPTGRLLGRREGYKVDMSKLLKSAKETNTVLEINANPRRLDLSSEVIRYQDQMFTTNTDAHHTDHLKFMEYGVSVLQKALVKKENVLNTMSRDKFKSFISSSK